MSIDYLVRKAAAAWIRDVSGEAPVVPERVALAKRLMETLSPATPVGDNVLIHCVFMIRVLTDDDATPAQIKTRFYTLADSVLVPLRAFV